MYSRNIKCVIVGDTSVGKSCLVFSYVTSHFPSDHVPRVFQNWEMSAMVGGQPYKMMLLDTAGDEEYARLRPLSYLSTDVILVCFSVAMPASFASVETDWFPEVRHHCPDVPYLLVGTQTDLRHDPSVLSREDQWLVTVEEGECLASRLGAVKYMECSALTQRGVKTVFDQAIITGAKHAADKRMPKKKGRCIVL